MTGGTGFIGSHLLAKMLAQKPKAVRVISSGSSPDRIVKHLARLDLKVYTNSHDYVKHIVNFKPDYLFILGGNSDPRLSVASPRLDLKYNLLYNFDLLQRLSADQFTTKIVYVSSIAVYGDEPAPLSEDYSKTSPKSPYGINKLAIEGYVRFFAECHSLKGFSVRLSPTYGPGLKKQVVYDFIQKLMKNSKKLIVLGDGSETRDLSYIDDQVNGLLLLAEQARYEGEVYNLGSGQGITIASLASKIVELMELKSDIIFERKKHEKHHGQTWVLDIKKAKGLGHRPKIKFDDGLKKTIDWVRQQ